MEIVKRLRLISPEHASRLGIPAECPVFVSQGVDAPVQCRLCPPGEHWWDYCPLVYGHGVETRAQHLHIAERSGGIYCTKRAHGPIAGTCWSALGESHAPVWEQQWGVVGATAVTLWQWAAECCRCGRGLTSGELVWNSMEIHPVCPSCAPRHFLPVPWQFAIGSDGACSFRRR